MSRFCYRLAWLGLLGLILISSFSAFAAANSVPPSVLGQFSQPITPNDLKPPECATLNLTQLVIGSSGGPNNDLVLGDAGVNMLNGGAGDDCIVGGGNNDTLTGNEGNDILLGSDGDDQLSGDAGTDECYGQTGNDVFDASCETQVQ